MPFRVPPPTHQGVSPPRASSSLPPESSPSSSSARVAPATRRGAFRSHAALQGRASPRGLRVSSGFAGRGALPVPLRAFHERALQLQGMSGFFFGVFERPRGARKIRRASIRTPSGARPGRPAPGACWGPSGRALLSPATASVGQGADRSRPDRAVLPCSVRSCCQRVLAGGRLRQPAVRGACCCAGVRRPRPCATAKAAAPTACEPRPPRHASWRCELLFLRSVGRAV